MNWKKVMDDMKAGEIDSDMLLVMDNDDAYWVAINDKLSEEEMEAKDDLYEKRYGRGKGYKDIVDVLVASGINADWC